MLSACWPGLGVVLPPEGRRSGEHRGSAALASPPRHGSELSCKLLKDGTALPSALDSLEG